MLNTQKLGETPSMRLWRLLREIKRKECEVWGGNTVLRWLECRNSLKVVKEKDWQGIKLIISPKPVDIKPRRSFDPAHFYGKCPCWLLQAVWPKHLKSPQVKAVGRSKEYGHVIYSMASCPATLFDHLVRDRPRPKILPTHP